MAKAGFKDTELYLLHEITIRLDRIARLRILAPAGITYPEFLVLMAARELPSPTQDDVGAFLDMSKSLVSQRVSALMKKGYLRQTDDPDNRRKVKLALTPRGAKGVGDIYRAMESASRQLLASLGNARGPFRDTLATLAELLAAEEGMARP